MGLFLFINEKAATLRIAASVLHCSDMVLVTDDITGYCCGTGTAGVTCCVPGLIGRYPWISLQGTIIIIRLFFINLNFIKNKLFVIF